MEPRKCALDGCDELLPTNHERRMYCSMSCAQKAYYRRKHHVQPRRDKCEECGGPLPEGCYYNRMYCSDTCRYYAKYHRKHPNAQRRSRKGIKTQRRSARREYYERVLYGR